jgi:hypothetical protein
MVISLSPTNLTLPSSHFFSFCQRYSFNSFATIFCSTASVRGMVHFSFWAGADIDGGRGALERETGEKKNGKQAECKFFQNSVSYLNKTIHKLTYL